MSLTENHFDHCETSETFRHCYGCDKIVKIGNGIEGVNDSTVALGTYLVDKYFVEYSLDVKDHKNQARIARFSHHGRKVVCYDCMRCHDEMQIRLKMYDPCTQESFDVGSKEFYDFISKYDYFCQYLGLGIGFYPQSLNDQDFHMQCGLKDTSKALKEGQVKHYTIKQIEEANNNNNTNTNKKIERPRVAISRVNREFEKLKASDKAEQEKQEKQAKQTTSDTLGHNSVPSTSISLPQLSVSRCDIL